jgi:hypothetical protein
VEEVEEHLQAAEAVLYERVVEEHPYRSAAEEGRTLLADLEEA